MLAARRMTRRQPWAAAALAALLAWMAAAPPAYGWRRPLEVAALRAAVLSYPELVAGPFLVVYPPGHRAVAALVLHDAAADYRVERASLGEALHQPLLIVIYRTQAALNASAGLPAADNNIGLYGAGSVRIDLPRAWIPSGPWQPAFQADGPVAHELGHALLDRAAHENYPAWFSEGVAQWEDVQATGYQWLTPNNQLHAGAVPYSWAALSGNFYALPHQSLAYREGLLLVEELQHRRYGGPTRFRQFLHALGGTQSFGATMQSAYHMKPAALYAAWRQTLPAP